MKYFLKEEFLKDSGARNAGNKARNDVEEIVKREGYQPLLIIGTIWEPLKLNNTRRKL